MAYKDNEKTFAADVRKDVLDTFESQRSQRRQIKKEALCAALKLWMSLPVEMQAKLIKQSDSDISFKAAVESLADGKIGNVMSKMRVLNQKRKDLIRQGAIDLSLYAVNIDITKSPKEQQKQAQAARPRPMKGLAPEEIALSYQLEEVNREIDNLCDYYKAVTGKDPKVENSEDITKKKY